MRENNPWKCTKHHTLMIHNNLRVSERGWCPWRGNKWSCFTVKTLIIFSMPFWPCSTLSLGLRALAKDWGADSFKPGLLMLEAWCVMIVSPFAVGSSGSASSSCQGKPWAPLRLSLESQKGGDFRGKPTQTRAGYLTVWNLAVWEQRLVFLALDGNFLWSQGKEGCREMEMEEKEWEKWDAKFIKNVGCRNQNLKHFDSNSFWLSLLNANLIQVNL